MSRETLSTTRENIIHHVLHEGSRSCEESQGSSFFSSTDSGEEPIPTDEELYAIGWAKALDPKSGSYYYFTLDRKQTVWENPLAPYSSQSQSEDSDDDDDNPDRAGEI